MKLSIIVCTRNRCSSLQRTLRSILDDASRVDRECVVVDNGSTDDTTDMVDRIGQGAAMPFRLVREARRGQSNARNRGIAESHGELILFVDDDVVVASGWADEIVKGFFEADVGAVGGRVIPRFPRPVPDWMKGPHLVNSALVDHGSDPITVSSADHNLPAGANLAFRRSLLSSPHAFEPSLGHSGVVAMGWDEWHVLCQIESSHRIAYAPRAVVEHWVDPSRLDYNDFRRRLFQNGFGLSRHERFSGRPEVDMARRLVRVTRAYRAARTLRCRNSERSTHTAQEAWEEFRAYQWAGKEIEAALSRFPRAAEWVASHVL